MITYSWDVQFSAQHFLTSLKGPDSKLHGHDFKITFVIENNESKGLSLRDLPRLSSQVLKKLDYENLNEVLPFEPVLENLAKWAFECVEEQMRVSGLLEAGFKLKSVTISSGRPGEPRVGFQND